MKVKAKVDEQQYNKGIKITDEQMKELNINRNDFRGKWNYIILNYYTEISVIRYFLPSMVIILSLFCWIKILTIVFCC